MTRAGRWYQFQPKRMHIPTSLHPTSLYPYIPLLQYNNWVVEEAHLDLLNVRPLLSQQETLVTVNSPTEQRHYSRYDAIPVTSTLYATVPYPLYPIPAEGRERIIQYLSLHYNHCTSLPPSSLIPNPPSSYSSSANDSESDLCP